MCANVLPAYVYVCAPGMCLVPLEVRASDSLELKLPRLPCECLVLNPGPLQVQQVSLTVEQTVVTISVDVGSRDEGGVPSKQSPSFGSFEFACVMFDCTSVIRFV